MYLIDTDIMIFMLKGHLEVKKNFQVHLADPKALSVVTYGELFYGAEKSTRPVENTAKIRRLSELLPIIDISSTVMETFGSLKAKLEKQGEKLDDLDIIIASTAIHMGYTLVTNNIRHFQRIPELTIENWAK